MSRRAIPRRADRVDPQTQREDRPGLRDALVETKEEDRYEGFVVRESGDEVEIRNIQGVATVLQLKNVASAASWKPPSCRWG